MRTESGDVFTDKSVVEFRYDKTGEPGMRWIPIKVRHDKTLARESGNAFHVANSNWYSLHYPVEEKMLKTGAITSIDSNESCDDYETGIYYQRQNQTRGQSQRARLINISHTKPLRDFHNKFVKRVLISSVATAGKTLIDFACGKGGDISKWIDCELQFVFGVDISEDNITNQYDGAYARYLNYAEFHSDANTNFMVFAKADSSKPLREFPPNALDVHERVIADTPEVDVYRAIKQTVFGERQHDAKLVGKALSKHYGVGRDGFDVSSIQFALHYFWKDVKTLHTFMRNVSECTKVGGHFIGTCYDGRTVFNRLKGLSNGSTLRFEDAEHQMIAAITKRYSKTDYLDDESCLGYSIDVFTESINAMHTEYLVNMVYLERIMRNYGFELVSETETKRDLFLPSGYGKSMGSFRDMFDMMTYYVKGMMPSSAELDAEESSVSLPKRAFPESHPMKKFQKFMNAASTESMFGKAREMEITNEAMKSVSFMNNYFVFKKIQHVDAKVISDAFIKNEGMVADAVIKEQTFQTFIDQQQQKQDLAPVQDKEKGKNKDKHKEPNKGSKVRKQIDGVAYILDIETGELFKSATSKDPVGKLKVSGNGRNKEIEFVNDEQAAKHQLQKEKASEIVKKRKHKDDKDE